MENKKENRAFNEMYIAAKNVLRERIQQKFQRTQGQNLMKKNQF